MTISKLIQALNGLKVETGSLACMGCGHEHNCSTHGCAILREAIDMVYKLIQPHDATDNPDWTPPATPAMWAAVSKEGEDGTLENPITAARGMEYVYGKYYRDPEDGKLYLCKRTGEEEGGKVTLQFLPHELVAQYFEEVQG